jgi:hypothetical protein
MLQYRIKQKGYGMTKICTECHLDLPRDEIHFAIRENGIFRSQCRKCINKKVVERQAKLLKEKREEASEKEKLELELFKDGYKVCTKCNQQMSVQQFHKHKDGKFGLESMCKNCKQGYKDKRYGKSYGAMRTCKTCGIKATNNEELKLFQKGSSYKFGRQPHCKKCYLSRESMIKSNNSLDKRCRKFGITVDDYNNLISIQNNSCAICNKHKDEFSGRGNNFHIDHCHTSGKVRGLLCSNCNTGLGQFKDNIKSLENAIQYLSSNI